MIQRLLTSVVCTAIVWVCPNAPGQDIDQELSHLAERLAVPVKENGKKKITVIDFTDLHGGTSGELGKYIAEQLTVDLVMEKRDFSVLDRANLKSILAEHKLTSQGLVDPENAKKLGMFAGVDALILGTIVPKHQTISLTAKIITTDTAEIIGAAKAEFKTDPNVEQLLSKPVTASEQNEGNAEEKPKKEPAAIVKSFGDLKAELQSLKIVNGQQYLLTFSLSNQNKSKSIWVGLEKTGGWSAKGQITDSTGSEYTIDVNSLSGISAADQFQGFNGRTQVRFEEASHPEHGFSPAVELKPGESTEVTMKFNSANGKRAEPGSCNLQLVVLVGRGFNPTTGTVTPVNLLAKIEAQ